VLGTKAVISLLVRDPDRYTVELVTTPTPAQPLSNSALNLVFGQRA
jgi:hypothetical protein